MEHQNMAPPAVEEEEDGPPSKYAKGGPGRPLTLDRKRPYPCDLCPSRFGSKMELEEHQNSHTGEKPFECEVCKARFNRRSTLWNHKRIHSDTKPFNCPVCQMTFKWKNSLKCHKEMHLRKNETSATELDLSGQITYAGASRGGGGVTPNGGGSTPTLLAPPAPKSKKKRAKAKAPSGRRSEDLGTPQDHPRVIMNGGGGTESPGVLMHSEMQQQSPAMLKSTLIQYNDMSSPAPNQQQQNGYSPPSDPGPPTSSAENHLMLGTPASLRNQVHQLPVATSHQGLLPPAPPAHHFAPAPPLGGGGHMQSQAHTSYAQSVLHIVSPTSAAALLTPTPTSTPANFFSPQGPSPAAPTPASVINGMLCGSYAPAPNVPTSGVDSGVASAMTHFGLTPGGEYMPNVDIMFQHHQALNPAAAMTAASHNHHHHHSFQTPPTQNPIDGAYFVKVLPFTEW